MKVIGLTGGIGSGKSTVSQFLAKLGAVVLDADKIGHEALKHDTKLWSELVNTFGRQILTHNGNIDRKKLGKIVFEDSESLLQLNRITHPQIYDVIKARLEKCQKQGVKVAVLEAPLLIEANWASLVDEVWVTIASEPAILKRLCSRSGLSKTESLARIHSQISEKERLKHADVVIDTDCNLDELKTKVKKLWSRLITSEASTNIP